LRWRIAIHCRHCDPAGIIFYSSDLVQGNTGTRHIVEAKTEVVRRTFAEHANPCARD
jgi:hypothetical protein